MIGFLFLLAGSCGPNGRRLRTTNLPSRNFEPIWIAKRIGRRKVPVLQGASGAKTDQAKKRCGGGHGTEKYQDSCLDHHQISKADFEWMFPSAPPRRGAPWHIIDGSYKTTGIGSMPEARTGRWIAAPRSNWMIYQNRNDGWQCSVTTTAPPPSNPRRQDQQTALAEVKRSAEAAAALETRRPALS